MRALLLLLLLPYFSAAGLWSSPSCPGSIKQRISNGGSKKKSDLQMIYKTLARCSRARNSTTHTLHLQIEQSGCVVNPNDRWNFDFHTGDVFPSLHQLHLNGYKFDEYTLQWQQDVWDQWHSIRQWFADFTGLKALMPTLRISGSATPGANLEKWKAAMNWTELKDLDLDHFDPVFFPLMKGHLPALESLRLGSLWSRSCRAGNVTEFVAQLKPLTRLSLHGHTNEVNMTQILDRHGSTLRTLEIREWEGGNFPRPTLSLQELQKISQECPSLSELGVDINRNGTWPFELLDSLAANKNLSSLELFFELGMDIHQDPSSPYSSGVNKTTDYRQPVLNTISSLSIFRRLRSLKQGVELKVLRLNVGDVGREYGHMLRFPGWGESLAEVYECSVLDSEGKGKDEEAVWCRQVSGPGDSNALQIFEEYSDDEENL